MRDTFIIVTRNPRNGRVVVIHDGDDDNDGIAQFDTDGEAAAAAANTTVCKVWGHQVVEVY